MRIVLALVITLGLAACGKKSEVDEFIGKMDGFKTKVCACKDMACLVPTQSQGTCPIADGTCRCEILRGRAAARGRA